MKQLNLFPYYEELIRSQEKTTTIRLGNKTNHYKIGDEIVITIGWEEKNGVKINHGKITNIYLKKISELNYEDLEGESPDCINKKSVKYVISSIYRKIVNNDDYVTVIKWKYNEDK